jgi:hypothetical protein
VGADVVAWRLLKFCFFVTIKVGIPVVVITPVSPAVIAQKQLPFN